MSPKNLSSWVSYLTKPHAEEAEVKNYVRVLRGWEEKLDERGFKRRKIRSETASSSSGVNKGLLLPLEKGEMALGLGASLVGKLNFMPGLSAVATQDYASVSLRVRVHYAKHEVADLWVAPGWPPEFQWYKDRLPQVVFRIFPDETETFPERRSLHTLEEMVGMGGDFVDSTVLALHKLAGSGFGYTTARYYGDPPTMHFLVPIWQKREAHTFSSAKAMLATDALFRIIDGYPTLVKPSQQAAAAVS